MGRKSMPGLDKQGSKLEMNRSSGPHEADTDGDDEILEAMRLDKERRVKEAGSDASGAAAAAASTTTATTDIDQAAGVLAKRRAEGRAVPAAPASAADVPELDEAAKSRLLTPSGSSHSNSSKMKVLGDGTNTAKSVKRKRTKTIKKEAGKLLVRLKQLVDGIDNPEDLPDYSVVRTSLIEEFVRRLRHDIVLGAPPTSHLPPPHHTTRCSTMMSHNDFEVAVPSASCMARDGSRKPEPLFAFAISVKFATRNGGDGSPPRVTPRPPLPAAAAAGGRIPLCIGERRHRPTVRQRGKQSCKQ